jgi:hypothetical protein
VYSRVSIGCHHLNMPAARGHEVAREVAPIRSDGFLYVDANTIAPGTMRDIACRFGQGVVVDATLTGARTPRAYQRRAAAIRVQITSGMLRSG